MYGAFARKLFGTRNDRVIKRLGRTVESINALETQLEALDDAALRARTDALRERRTSGASVEDVLVEAFALVREAGKRALGMRAYDVQLVGGMVLNQSRIAEMRTGEGKTLVATLPIYLNALAGEGAHLVTVNDYLARRDATWMGRLYHALGMSTGVINGSGGLGPDAASYLFDPEWSGGEGGFAYLRPVTRREAYAADITYGTNNEFGFDYLRDNMRMSDEDRCQRGLHFALVDEVDSILIDEARTPLIISGPATASEDLYGAINALIPKLDKPSGPEDEDADYTLEEKSKQVLLTESGHDKVEQLMIEAGLINENASLYDPGSISLLHHLGAALRAHAIYTRDVDYIVKDDQIVIVDEFTGRTMPGRRWSEGLHQAVEAKEGVSIQAENQTVASITFQNYFRLYEKLGGMTGTADTEAAEFQQIYSLEVVVVPTNREMIRDDRPDLVYLTQEEKYSAIIEDIEECVAAKRPVLVGTASIESSELVSKLLNDKSVPHQVLNAKQPEREANIIAQAGRPGVVTIATNMAGRGTDIVLGGNLESELADLGVEATDERRAALRADWDTRHKTVLEADGLHIIATERHESRRIDNQLRGRAGRQGDPGSSRFYLSLQDNLMRIFASDRVAGLMQKLGMEEGEAIEHPWVTKAIENAQRKVEAHNFDIRKHLLEYDDVANDQRKVIYEQRNDLLGAKDMSEAVLGIREDVVIGLLAEYIPPGSLDEQWDVEGARAAFKEQFAIEIDIQAWLDADKDLDEEGIRDRLLDKLVESHKQKTEMAGAENMQRFEKFVLLRTLDEHWREHLAAMDHLRQSVGLRGYAQKNPKQEYKRESFELFSSLLDAFQREAISTISRVVIRDPAEVEAAERAQRVAAAQQAMQFQHAGAQSALDEPVPEPAAASAGGGGRPAQGATRKVRFQQQGGSPATPFVRDAPKIGRNDPCWCGSGKKFKHCHGKLN